MTSPWLVVGIPFNRDIDMLWAIRWRQLLLPQRSHTHLVYNKPIDVARNDCVRKMLGMGALWLLFLDSDIVPPADGVQRLLADAGMLKNGNPERKVISGLCHRRSPNKDGIYEPMILKEDGEGYAVDWEAAKAEPGLKDVAAVGMAFTLIHTQVFEAIEPPWFRWGQFGEDVEFSRRVRAIGFQMCVDTSLLCLHIGRSVISGPNGERAAVQSAQAVSHE